MKGPTQMVTNDTTLPPPLWPDDSPRARRTDYETSHEAADTNDVEGSRAEVLTILDAGPQDDFQIWEAHDRAVHRFGGPRYTPQRLRTARSELVREGRVEFTGIYHLSPSNRRTRVWNVKAVA